MAPRHRRLLLLLAAAACFLLLAAAPATPARRSLADDAPRCRTRHRLHHRHRGRLHLGQRPLRRATTRASDVDSDVLLRGGGGFIRLATSGTGTDGDHAVDECTVYDVTVILRATRRPGPPRVQYYVVPSNNDDDELSAVTVVLVLFVMLVVAVALVFLLFWVVDCAPGGDEEEEARSGGGGGATPRKTGGTGGLFQGLCAQLGFAA